MTPPIAVRRRQSGQSSTEYFVVVALGILVLIEGGNSSAVSQVVAALKDLYQGFGYAISFSTLLNAL